MTFPRTPLDARIDLQIDGVWTNVTSDVLVKDGITITRGRANEASRPGPQQCSLTFKGQSGKYSPRNPSSPWYGLLGRNTPLRVGVGRPPVAATMALPAGGTFALNAPGVTVEEAGWMFCVWGAQPVGNMTLPGAFTAATERDGLVSTWGAGVAAAAPGTYGAQTATPSVAATSYAAVTIAVPGASSTWAGYSGLVDTGGSIVTVTAPVVAGDYVLAVQGYSSDPDDEMVRPPGETQAQSPNWILLADSGPSAGPRMKAWYRRIEKTGTFEANFVGLVGTENYGRIWVITGATEYFCRFTGEVPSWPPQWDASGTDVRVPVTATGVKRRLSQGAALLQSALRRQLVKTAGITGYWPLEDGTESTRFASALGGAPMTFVGTPTLAADTNVPCSDPLPTFNAAGARVGIPAYKTTGEFVAGSLIYLPTGLVDQATLLTVAATGTAVSWSVSYSSGVPGFWLRAYDTTGTQIVDVPMGPWTTAPIGTPGYLYFSARQLGGNVEWKVTWVPILNTGEAPISQSVTGTLVGYTCGNITGLTIGAGAVPLNQEVAFGHVVIGTNRNALFVANVFDALVGWAGEVAQARLARLALEEDVNLTYQSFAGNQSDMGVQRPGTLLELMEQAEDTDGGTLAEPRGFIGFLYRPRSSRYDQSAALTLNYRTPGHIAAPLEPVDDDQSTRNDVTVTRIGGGSSRDELTDGPLSVNPPPDGVGRYETNYDLSLRSDDDTPDQASWRLHLGTWDEARWPVVRTLLHAAPSLIPTVQALDIGDLVTLTNLPTWVPPGDVDLLLEGYTETLTPFTWDWVGNYSPAGPYRVAMADSATYGRADSDTSTLAAGATSTATSFSVAVAAGSALWITTATFPAQFPFTATVGGEEVSVTAIVGVTSPQTWTVVRSTNGVIKTQAAGAQIRLARPVVAAL